MLLWVIFAVMTAAALLTILVPLGRRGAADTSPGSGVSVYRDQLRAVTADVDRGLLDEAEAEAARIEISRRLLAEAEAERAETRSAPGPASMVRSAGALCAAAVAVALGGYLALGSPNLQGAPAAQRQSADMDRRQLTDLVTRVEAHLLKNPRDGDGWDVVAPAYMRLREFAKAGRAFTFAIDLLGPSADRYGGLGEAITMQGNGLVTEQAREAFEKSLELNPDLVRPRYFLGVAHEQEQQWDKAAEVWRHLLNTTPDQAPYRPMLERKLTEASAQADGNAAPGPTADDIERARSLSAEERRDMIDQMVAGLAERLEQDGDDIEGWLRLIRSYAVLGRTEDARAATTGARTQFAGRGGELARINALAEELDLAQ